MSDCSIAAIKVFIQDLRDFASQEGNAKLIAVPASLSAKVSFLAQLEVVGTDRHSSLIKINSKQSLVIREPQPITTISCFGVSAKQIHMKRAPLVDVI
jgi:hypothetical protein